MSTFRPVDLTLAAVTAETPDAVTLAFNDPEGALAGYLPGQFLTLNVEIGGKWHRRSYSLCSAPGQDAHPTVCVKRVPGGLVSNHLVDNWRAGQTMQVFTPIGNFTCEPRPGARRHIVLVGAGSGITPLWSIAKTILAQEPGSHVSLIYGNRRPDCVIFDAPIQQWQARHADRFRVVHCLTQPPAGWQGATGRINGAMVLDLLRHLEPLQEVEETRYYLCGPQAMADDVEQALLGTGVVRRNIFRESFFSDALVNHQDTVEVGQVQTVEAGHGPFTVTVKHDGETFEVAVPEGETILQAALDQDIDLPYSCQAGLCTACRAKCLSGAVEMDETEGLVESEIREGYVLLCVGHPKSAGVVVEVG